MIPVLVVLSPIPPQGLRSIGPFVAPGFAEIIKERNKLARLMGFEDFYDYKVRGTAAVYGSSVMRRYPAPDQSAVAPRDNVRALHSVQEWRCPLAHTLHPHTVNARTCVSLPCICLTLAGDCGRGLRQAAAV